MIVEKKKKNINLLEIWWCHHHGDKRTRQFHTKQKHKFDLSSASNGSIKWSAIFILILLQRIRFFLSHVEHSNKYPMPIFVFDVWMLCWLAFIFAPSFKFAGISFQLYYCGNILMFVLLFVSFFRWIKMPTIFEL